MPGDQSKDRPGGQQIRADRDAFGAGRDITVNNYFGTAAENPVYAGSEKSAARHVWGHVPARNPGFVDRRLLADIRRALVSGDRAVAQALNGMGGVGKTQLAAEYAHRYADGYDIVWWVTAEHADLIGEQFAALGQVLGWLPRGTSSAVAQRVVLMTLREQQRWLLVFDNADRPEDIAGWLPGGAGHVLITSRTQGWDEVALPLIVGVLERQESVALLRRRIPSLPVEEADTVAEAAGDLPLAVAQAGGYLAATGVPAGEYVGLLRERAAEILSEGRPPSYRLPLTAVTQTAFGQLRTEDPGAAELLAVCAFLAPEHVPAHWLGNAAAELPGPLGERVGEPVAWHQMLARVNRTALAQVGPDGIVLHRLTMAILRGTLSQQEADDARRLAGKVLVANDPGDPAAPGTWPGWSLMLQHLLALDPASAGTGALLHLAAAACEYLLRSGQLSASRDLSGRLQGSWAAWLGRGHPQVLQVASTLGRTLHEMGLYESARQLDADTLERRRRILGHDHPDTLISASNLAADLRQLGNLAAARELNEDTLARRRRILGEDHPMTLSSSHNLARTLASLGDNRAALALDEDALKRGRRALGEDHPLTLAFAHSLAVDFCDAGDFQSARDLDEDTLTRQRRILGQDHPDTLATAFNLADDLRELGHLEDARELDQDTLTRRTRILGEDHFRTRRSAEALAEDVRLLNGTQAKNM